MSVLLVALFITTAGTSYRTTDPAEETERRVRARIEHLRPAGVSTTAVTVGNPRVVVRGHSSNVNAIANFVENVKNDSFFDEPMVNFVTQRDNSSTPIYDFEFSAAVRKEK